MRFADYIRLAFKNIGRQKLRSSLTIFAVVIGATSVTIMLALVTGVKTFFISQFENSGAMQQVIVTQATDLDYDQARFGGRQSKDGVKLNDELVKKVAAVNHVKAASPTTYVNVFESVSYKDKKLAIQNTQAYEPNGVFKHTILAGRDLEAGDGTGTVVVTSSYADKFGFKDNYAGLVGQALTLKTQDFFTGIGADLKKPEQPQPGKPMPPMQQGPTELQGKVVGVVSDSDSDATIFFPMKWARDLSINQRWEPEQMSYNPQPGRNTPAPAPTYKLVVENQLEGNGFQSITLMVDNTKNVETVATEVRKLGVGAVTAKSFVQQQLTIFNILGAVLGGIGGIALAVAAIGVINTMVMATLERTREIGVMRACGATRRAVRRLFTFEAGLLGFMGGVVGLGIGFGMTKIANKVLGDKFSGNGLDMSNLITLPVWLILAVLGITTLIGIGAGLYPANRASRLNPVEALRYE